MLVPNEVKQQIETELHRCITVANDTFEVDLEFPKIEYNLTGTTAGTAACTSWTIQLNPILLMDNIDAYLKRTVPHEMAHLITGTVYPHTNMRTYGSKRSPHGKEWKRIMILLGADPSRCHTYDVSKVKRKSARYDYRCICCDKIVTLGIKSHNKAKMAVIKGMVAYSHKGCKGGELVWNIYAKQTLIPEVNKKPNTAIVSESKKDNAIVLVKEAQGQGRSRIEIINTLQNILGMTKAGATTYYYNIDSGKWA